jgi:hypothetical protein
LMGGRDGFGPSSLNTKEVFSQPVSTKSLCRRAI